MIRNKKIPTTIPAILPEVREFGVSGKGSGRGPGSGGSPVQVQSSHGIILTISNGQRGGQSGLLHCVKLYTMQGP